MPDRNPKTIEHTRNPRTTVVRYGANRSGITLEIGRKGIEVVAYYDSVGGISGGFMSWEEFDRCRSMARRSLKDVVAELATEALVKEIL